MIFDKHNAEVSLNKAIQNNSEHELLAVLKENSFLFFDLYSRKMGVQPNFCEVSLGTKYRCDFCWLNDNSDGPEWVLLEVEKPSVKLFKSNKEPTAELNHAIEQVNTWNRYLQQNPMEKERIFGAVSRFRFLLVVGQKADWQTANAASWRSHHNGNSLIEIRSMDTFFKSLQLYKEDSEHLSFEQHPKSRKASEIEQYCKDSEYLVAWKSKLG